MINWKTTASGVIVILLGAANSFFGLQIPGFALDLGSAIPIGIGLILSKDYNVTGGTIKQ